jgi:hypothetical protein
VGIRRWFVTPQQLVVPVELSTILMREQDSDGASSTFTTRTPFPTGVPSP